MIKIKNNEMKEKKRELGGEDTTSKMEDDQIRSVLQFL